MGFYLFHSVKGNPDYYEQRGSTKPEAGDSGNAYDYIGQNGNQSQKYTPAYGKA
jgi:hypothetical protein